MEYLHSQTWSSYLGDTYSLLFIYFVLFSFFFFIRRGVSRKWSKWGKQLHKLHTSNKVDTTKSRECIARITDVTELAPT